MLKCWIAINNRVSAKKNLFKNNRFFEVIVLYVGSNFADNCLKNLGNEFFGIDILMTDLPSQSCVQIACAMTDLKICICRQGDDVDSKLCHITWLDAIKMCLWAIERTTPLSDSLMGIGVWQPWHVLVYVYVIVKVWIMACFTLVFV